MDGIAWALFIPACFALNMAPGPNNLLAFTNAARFGMMRAIAGGAGRLAAFALMIMLVAIGLGALLAASETAFLTVKWLGAAYLVYVGVKLLRSRFDASGAPLEKSARIGELIRHEFLLAAGNPKAIAIFTAFFPQFIQPDHSISAQLLAMGCVFLLLECVALSLYVLGGRLARGVIRSGRTFGWLNKGVGVFLVGSGISLAFNSK